MQLAPNFQLSELLVSQTASRRGIGEQFDPPANVVDRLAILARDGLQPIRDKFGPVVVSSGYRCNRVNSLVGGARMSDHLIGWAADFTVPGVPLLTVAKWIQKNINYHQLILEYGSLRNPAWLHLSLNPRMANQILRIGPGESYSLTREKLQSL
jgi:hypothetical protein